MITTLEPSLSVRGKIIAALKADAQLNALVPAARVYPSKVPANPSWPFIRVGTLLSEPARHDGGGGGRASGVVHNFTKLAPGVPDPEALAGTINAHVVRILDGIDNLLVDGEADMGISVTQAQVIEDSAEADAYHGLVSVEALTT